MKKIGVTVGTIALVFIVGISAGCSNTVEIQGNGSQETADETIYYPNPSIKENLPAEQPSAAEDFYLSVNYEGIKNTEIPEGSNSYAASNQISTQVEAEMIDLLEHTEDTDDSELLMASEMYQMYIDMDARNEDGWDYIIPYVEMVREADSVQELLDMVISNDELIYTTSVFNIGVTIDEKDSTKYIFVIKTPNLDLDDSAEYTEKTELGELYHEADEVYFQELLTKYGYSEDEAAAMIENRYEWEALQAEYLYPTSVSYQSDYRQLIYNTYSFDELKELAGDYPLAQLLESKGCDKFSKYLVYEPDYIEALDTLYTDENLELIKSSMVIEILKDAAIYSDEESYEYYNDWVNATYGSSGMKSIEKLGYRFVCNWLPELVGNIYAGQFFSEEEKKDVEDMVYRIIAALRTRLENADWMTETTRNTAIEKLDSISVCIGYPEEYYYDYSVMKVDTEKGMYENLANFRSAINNQIYQKADTEVNKAAWGCMLPANNVNACYVPSYNCICFPAAILSEPFYSKDASESANLGAIGTIIGHELTHAFDTTGSQFDKDGNLVNWWTDEDFEKFTELTGAVADRYAAYATVDDEKVNGNLTIGETVADLGGMAVTLDVMSDMAQQGLEVDYQDYFTAYAKMWLEVTTRETALYCLKNDPHAPCCLRTNVNVMQFQEFYDTFGIVEGDAMYTAPENRLSVW